MHNRISPSCVVRCCVRGINVWIYGFSASSNRDPSTQPYATQWVELSRTKYTRSSKSPGKLLNETRFFIHIRKLSDISFHTFPRTWIESISLNLHSRVKIEDESHGCAAKFSREEISARQGVLLDGCGCWNCPFCLSPAIPLGRPGEHWQDKHEPSSRCWKWSQKCGKQTRRDW